MIVSNKYYTILDSGEAFYSNLGTVGGTDMGAVFLGCWNHSDLFGITGRGPGMSVEPGSNTAEGFSDELFCKMLFQHKGQATL